MSRAGEEMILALAGLLGTETVKTAAKKDDDKDDKKDKAKAKEKKDKAKEKEEKEKAEKKEKDDKKKEKEDKKASVMFGVLQNLVKLAGELDEMGADEASILVDDALKVIVDGLKEEGTVSDSEQPKMVDLSDTSVDEKVVQLSQEDRATLKGLLSKMGY
ncbi:hypothetical protein LCGC14_1493930 [marine sediment metagenome]|uniref:Uncharacterized protein n=1 Tax=marine sediment metagenome TaxID=412755 RepID=A0A0F9JRU8_9ZZZZ